MPAKDRDRAPHGARPAAGHHHVVPRGTGDRVKTPGTILPFPTPTTAPSNREELIRVLDQAVAMPGLWRDVATEIDLAVSARDKAKLDALGLICLAFVARWSTLTPTALAAQVFGGRDAG
jgi:hypothetical protein